MRLLSLDYDPVYGEHTDRSTFRSDISSFDYDVVIWDPAQSMQSYFRQYPEFFRGLPCVTEHESVRVQADVVRRNAEFVEFIQGGRTLVVMVRPPQESYIDTGERSYSGTGRNQKTTTHLAKFNLLRALPVADCKFILSSGTKVEFIGDGPLLDLLRKYKEYVIYRSYLPSAPGEAIARVIGTDRVVGSVMRIKNGGSLILLPDLDFERSAPDEPRGKDEDEDEAEDIDEDDVDKDGDEAIWLPEAASFEQDLLDAIAALSSSKSVSWPSWADRFMTEEQERLRADIVGQQKRIEAARAKLSKMERLKNAAESKNQLFLGFGRALELEVKEVLELLGGTVIEPNPGRDDWKVSFPEGRAVVEVKGTNKSAAERHAAQLEKWVASELEDTGEAPKGILVVNTWRDLPLDERTGVDFPEQMLPYSEGRNHCLITGLQLFVIRAEVEKDPTQAERWRRALLDTSGRLEGCDDWQSIVSASGRA